MWSKYPKSLVDWVRGQPDAAELPPAPPGKNSSGSGSARSRPEGLPERRPLPADEVPGLRHVMHTHIASTNRFVRDKSRAGELDEARMASIRQLSAMVHRDVIPPEPANLVFAQLVRARALILNSVQGPSGDKPLALAGLLFLGEHHNRWRAHNGLASNKLPPLLVGAGGGKDDFAAAKAGFAHVGTSRLQVWPKAAGNASVIAHESVHEAQFTRQQGFDTSHHARAGFLEAAKGVPNLDPGAEDAESAKTLYANDPTEMQAYLEEVHLRALLPGAVGMQSLESAPELRLHELADLLGEVAHALNAAQTGTVKPDGRGVIAEFDPACHPGAGEAVERILRSTASLHQAAESQAWHSEVADQWRRTLEALKQRADSVMAEPSTGSGLSGFANALENFLVDAPGRRGAQALELIADTLETFLDRLMPAHGHAAHAPKGAQVTAQDFNAAKTDPAGMLQRLLEQSGYAHADSIRTATAAAKRDAGFSRGVADLKARIENRERITGDDLRDVVMRLAGPLLGLEPARLPMALMPAVNLYDPPSAELPKVAGLNGVSHQKRKASFDIAAWQLHVPRHLLDEPGRLEPRLAGLAADLAYAAVCLHEEKQFEDHHPLFAVWYGPLTKRFTRALDAEGVSAASQEFLQRRPDSAAAMLRALVRALDAEQGDNGIKARAWHVGARAEVKQASSAGGASVAPATSHADDTHAAADARRAYQSRAYQRWQTHAVAFRRAIAGDVR